MPNTEPSRTAVTYDQDQLLVSETAYRILRSLHDNPDYGTSIAAGLDKDPGSIRNFLRSMHAYGFLTAPADLDVRGNKQYYTIDHDGLFHVWQHLLVDAYTEVTDGRDALIETVDDQLAHRPGSPYEPLFRNWLDAYLTEIETSTCQKMLLDDMADALELHLHTLRRTTTDAGDAFEQLSSAEQRLNSVLRVAATQGTPNLVAVAEAAFHD
ncbi:MAG: hypothetical protein SVU32_09300 [Candidatus Nanohaloarchaea archaeon]|nr:hypothetical protein [Candidatus Nanohaloarchaea archaeon]